MRHLRFSQFLLDKYMVLADPEGKGIPCRNMNDLEEYLKRRKNINLSGVHFSKDQKVVIKNRHLNFLVITDATFEGGIEIDNVIIEKGLIISEPSQFSGPIKINVKCRYIATEIKSDEKRKISISVE